MLINKHNFVKTKHKWNIPTEICTNCGMSREYFEEFRKPECDQPGKVKLADEDYYELYRAVQQFKPVMEILDFCSVQDDHIIIHCPNHTIRKADLSRLILAVNTVLERGL